MRKPIILLDYAKDSVYGFGGPFFFSLSRQFAVVVVNLFLSSGFIPLFTTAQLLTLYEDQLTGIESGILCLLEHDHKEELALYDSDSEEIEELIDKLKEKEKDWIQETRLKFRKETEQFKDWPLPQFIFSALYRYMVFAACPSQSLLWDCLVRDDPNTQAVREAFETGDENSVMLALDTYTRSTGFQTLAKEKEVRVLDETFWSGRLGHIIFLEQNKSLSLGVIALFSYFASRNNGLERETELRAGILRMFRHARFTKGYWNAVNAIFFSFIVIPLLEAVGVPPLDARLAALQYVETKEVQPLRDLLKEELL